MADGAAPQWLPAFRQFITLVKVQSKDDTEPKPLKLYRAQEMFIEEVVGGLTDDIHFFVCLKARQLGISTVMQVFDIFWNYMYPGLQGAFIADKDTNKESFRQTFVQMLDGLPRGWRVPIRIHNRNELIFNNGSRMQYMSAGKGKNSGLGRSRALNFVHGTECSSWGDQAGLDSLTRALSEINPNRFYAFESTALGFNVFHEMYQEAKESPDKKAFFIGWWAKDTYMLEEASRGFDHWWGQYPQLTDEEAEKTAIVKELYGWDITPEQWAWYRQQSFQKSEESMHEELPSHETEAWVATGTQFFSSKRVTADMNFVTTSKVRFSGYTYHLGDTFLSTVVEQVNSLDAVDLRVWEEPKPGAKYVIGADPAFGSSENKDGSCIEVFRCYADKLVQVAEYNTHKPESQQVAWVLAHLAGCYRDCIANLEINGPGAQVMQELKYLKQQISFGALKETAAKLDVSTALDQMRWFLYHRPDQMGTGFVYNFKSNYSSKLWIMNLLRDTYNTNLLAVRSVPMLNEMLTLRQDGDTIAASGRNKDDRCISGALAVMAWSEWIRPGMMAENRTFVREQEKETAREAIGGDVVDSLISNFFAQKKRERSEAELRQLLGRY